MPTVAREPAPYHVVQRELGSLSKNVAVHRDHGTAVIVETVPVTALLIGQQVNPAVLEKAEPTGGVSAVVHPSAFHRPKHGRLCRAGSRRLQTPPALWVTVSTPSREGTGVQDCHAAGLTWPSEHQASCKTCFCLPTTPRGRRCRLHQRGGETGVQKEQTPTSRSWDSDPARLNAHLSRE